MELNTVPKVGTWTDVAQVLNQNFTSISGEMEEVKSDVNLSKGYFRTLNELRTAYPTPQLNSWAYVGTSFPAAIYKYTNSGWTDTGKTGSFPDVDLTDYMTGVEITDPTSILVDYK